MIARRKRLSRTCYSLDDRAAIANHTSMPVDFEAEESNRVAVATWKLFAARTPRGAVREFEGATAAFSGVIMPFFNMAFLTSPVRSEEDLDRRLDQLRKFAAPAVLEWMLLVCDAWLPEAMRDENSFRRRSFEPAMHLIGMASERLFDIERVPELSIRRVDDAATREAISTINCLAYDMSPELGKDSMAASYFWRETDYAYVGYLDGAPVTAAGVWNIDGLLYVAMVATMPEYRRRGLAERIMSHALAQAQRATGLRRSVLHATDAGLPIYRRMGYRPVAVFAGYMPL